MTAKTLRVRIFLVSFATLSLAMAACTRSEKPDSAPGISTGGRVAIGLAPAAADSVALLGLDTPIKGRVYLIATHSDESEPRQQTDVNGVPFWGMDVEGLQGDGQVVLADGDPGVRGFPLERISDLPAGDYFVQAFLNVYTTFNRSDGRTVSMHLNSGAGQNLWSAPGNVKSGVAKVTIASGRTLDVSLTLDSVIPPREPLAEGEVLQQGNPRDTDWVKYVKIRSEKLSAFWGRPMYIGANILLPAGYTEQSDGRYPVLYLQGHFPGRSAPLGFTEEGQGRGRNAGFADFWKAADTPHMLAVTIRDANPYYDTSYSVNSENVGPYGDAITEELIPYIESKFRTIPASWARVLAGGSTGGWETLAMQIFYPDEFGGAWGWCPDPVDFNYYQIVNVYDDDNAYSMGNEWHQVERPNTRRPDGNISSTVRQENYMELATGPNSRSGGQWAIWEAVFGPVGSDGYPRRIWDPVTGAIDHETADYWRSHFDLRQYLASNWETVGPKIDGKLHVAVGDMDTYYLDDAVYLLDEFLGSATSPKVSYSVQYGRRKPHCWVGESPNRPGETMTNMEFVRVAADYMRQNAPAGSDLSWFR